MIWKWIKKIFQPKRQKPEYDFSKMTKGDLKKLKEKGNIKDIYNPNN